MSSCSAQLLLQNPKSAGLPFSLTSFLLQYVPARPAASVLSSASLLGWPPLVKPRACNMPADAAMHGCPVLPSMVASATRTCLSLGHHITVTSLCTAVTWLSHGCARLSLVCHLAVTSLCTAATPLHPFVTLPSVSLSLHCSARRRRGSSGPYMPQVKTCVLLFGIQLNCVCVRECIFAH